MTRYNDDDTVAETHSAPADIPTADQRARASDEMPDEAKVSIVGGQSEFEIPNAPMENEYRTYVVKAFCKERRSKIIDGERRIVCVMEHVAIYDKALGPLNEGDRNQGALFDFDGDGPDDSAPGGDEPEAVGTIMTGLISAVPDEADDDRPNGEERQSAIFSDGGEK